MFCDEILTDGFLRGGDSFIVGYGFNCRFEPAEGFKLSTSLAFATSNVAALVLLVSDGFRSSIFGALLLSDDELF